MTTNNLSRACSTSDLPTPVQHAIAGQSAGLRAATHAQNDGRTIFAPPQGTRTRVRPREPPANTPHKASTETEPTGRRATRLAMSGPLVHARADGKKDSLAASHSRTASR